MSEELTRLYKEFVEELDNFMEELKDMKLYTLIDFETKKVILKSQWIDTILDELQYLLTNYPNNRYLVKYDISNNN